MTRRTPRSPGTPGTSGTSGIPGTPITRSHRGPHDPHSSGSSPPPPSSGPVADTRGGLKLVAAGTRHVTGLVEALHGQIQRLAPPLRRRAVPANSPDMGNAPGTDPGDGLPPTRGITGLVYRSIQGTARWVGDGLDGLLAPFDGALASGAPSPRRDAVVAALNGVLGDHLLRSGNPLAISMQMRQNGQAFDPASLGAGPGKPAPAHLLLLVHGLCMSDGGWCRNGHDHGRELAKVLGAEPVYAFYNSGQHISANGLDLANALQALVAQWPVPLQRITLIGHSMGGLVGRSACAQAAGLGHTWPGLLQQMVFLGTPHHGAPLERAGNWLHRVMDLSPYVAPFTRLSRLRSEGITDLRHGNLLASDWQGHARYDHADRRSPVPLPPGVGCYAIASTVGGPDSRGSMLGDGLVPLESALGHHRRLAMRLKLPDDHTWVGHGIHHLDLLSDPVVYRRLLCWLQ